MMKKNGFILVELIVSITFVSIVSLIIINTVIHMTSMLSDTIQYRNEFEDKTTIHNILSVKFATQNIKSISSIANGYAFSFKNTETKVYNDISVKLESGTLYVDGQPFESNEYIEYKNLSLTEYKLDGEKKYLKLTIKTLVNDEDSDINIYYLNDMDYTTSGSLGSDTI